MEPKRTCNNCEHLSVMQIGSLHFDVECVKNAEPDPMPPDWDGEGCELHSWDDKHWMWR